MSDINSSHRHHTTVVDSGTTRRKSPQSPASSVDDEEGDEFVEASEGGATGGIPAPATEHHHDPYMGVYSTAASSVPTVCMSTSTSAYTVDSRCELLRGGGKGGKMSGSGGGGNGGMGGHHRDEEDEELSRGLWGFGSFRPDFLQQCANVKMFIFHCCMFSTVSGALIAGYVNSVITTIEKRFDIGSSHSGLIAASVELGSLLAVLFVSYFGGSRHIPLWIGCGAFLQGVGAIIFTLPHFLTQSYTVTGGLNTNSTLDSNICQIPQSLIEHSGMGSSSSSSSSLFKDDLGSAGDRSTSASSWSMCEEESVTGSYMELNIFILIAAQAMIGVGGAPLFTLGTTYIDDHVHPEQAPACIGE